MLYTFSAPSIERFFAAKFAVSMPESRVRHVPDGRRSPPHARRRLVRESLEEESIAADTLSAGAALLTLAGMVCLWYRNSDLDSNLSTLNPSRTVPRTATSVEMEETTWKLHVCFLNAFRVRFEAIMAYVSTCSLLSACCHKDQRTSLTSKK
jgi:hypothetical protein